MDESAEQRILWYGTRQELPPQIELRAGPLTAMFEHGSLRYVRLGDREVVRSIYCAVRDANWGTVPNHISDLRAEIGEHSFRLSFSVENIEGPIEFAWRATVEGQADGQIMFQMDGEARTVFLKNRIGFCILHPPRECAGAPYRVRHADGTVTEGHFPIWIAPENPIRQISAIAHQLTSDVWAELTLEGDTFEMEDQRNWTDASFKTFCTPLDRPFPAPVQAGDRVSQRITLSLLPSAASNVESTETAGRVLVGSHGLLRGLVSVPASQRLEPRLEVGTQPVARLPRIGLKCIPDLNPFDELTASRLRVLGLAHLRVDLHLGEPAWVGQLERAQQQSRSLQVPLEIALILTDDTPGELTDFVQRIQTLKPSVARWLLFHRDVWSSEFRALDFGREVLNRFDKTVPVGAGTKANFTELNRCRPPTDAIDFIVYSMNPQEHAVDNASLVETLETQADTVSTARQFARGLPIVVSSVTLRKQVNPYATGAGGESASDQLPPTVDPRQTSLLGAGWTLGSVKYLAESGVASITYYEAEGWRGVLSGPSGLPLPASFPAVPNSVFPMFHVFADLGEVAGAEVIPVSASHPLVANALAVRRAGRLQFMAANMTPTEIELSLSGLDVRQVRLRILDDTVAMRAMREPEWYRAQVGSVVPVGDRRLKLRLRPFAYAWAEAIP